MKKSNQDLNSIFAIAEEMVKNNGEDCYCYAATDKRFIISSFDGLGGSGAKKYENYSAKTGAYIASRAVSGAVNAWFDDSYNSEELAEYIREALGICNEFADKTTSRLRGGLFKSFPTTAAILTGNFGSDNLTVNCCWAGDSRCYMLDANGLHQLTEDDLDGQDAMSNLKNDGVMTNVINASTSFEIHRKSFAFDAPCILLTATDGCFGYLKSPMEFEHLLVDSLVKSKSILEWKIALNERMHAVTGDDYTLCVAVCGFESFEDIRKNFAKRNALVFDRYINTGEDVNTLWNVYKKEYSKYL